MYTALPPSTAAPRVAGALGLVHVVLMIGGLAITGGGALIEDGTEGIERAYVRGDLTIIFAGWFVESIGFVLLLPVAVFLARSLGRTTTLGRWAALTGLILVSGYVTITLAVGFPAGAAAAFGVKNGLDLETAAAMNSMRVFAYLLSLLCLGAHVVCVALSALADGFSRWFTGILGLVTGASLLAAAPLARLGLQDIPTLVYLVWWIGLCVILLRGHPVVTETLPEPLVGKAELRQA
ncbi:hypothetical protein LKO27_04355 [Tessaracoccus sp. OS52]|uniref:hypothetical protein n=1 Tax=Tessaracoccus sp. OS52 TaxID=2886691 RepID=UPI001D102E87|nr:hypothetical protein [Tessaracoccus sp. OS52]MCC2592648.1 hypothetical protein [Tessaracoccus sp. OS52]